MKALRAPVVFASILTAASAAKAQEPTEAPTPPATPAAAAPGPAAAPSPSRAAKAEYRDNVIVFSEEEWAEVHLDRTPFSTTGRVDIHRELHAMRGERREDIDGPAFYELVGRPDLADAYRTRRKVRIAGLVTSGVGAAVAVYGLVSFATAEDHTAACDWERPDYHDCFKAGMDADHAETMGNIRTIGVGMGIAVVGGLVWRFVAKDPVDNDTRRGLAAVYNRELRERLGIPEVSRVEVNPYASASGGGIAITGQF
jgi:hypothetical protein